MSKLCLGEVMTEIFPAIAEGQPEPYVEYRTKVKELDQLDRLSADHVAEIIAPDSLEQTLLPGAVRRALQSAIYGDRPSITSYQAFEPGATVLIAESSGTMRGVYHHPNRKPQLQAYGNGLLWAAMKLGDESYAYANGSSTADTRDNTGYLAVIKALTGKEIADIPFKDRPHLGGASLDLSRHPVYGDKGPLLHAGVSGILVTETAFDEMLQNSDIAWILKRHAETEDADDKFVGNIFAGSLDSQIGQLILHEITRTAPSPDVSIDVTVCQFANGVNIH